MVEVVSILALLVLVDIASSLGVIAWLYREKLELEDVHERFDELSNSLNVVAEVLTRLPEMVPQFQINNNPFAPLIEAFAQKMRENMGERSITDPLLRDDTGRFTDDGETREEAPSP